MKLRLGLLIIFSSVYFISQAQIQLGVTGALNFSDVSGNGMSAKDRAGVDIGGYAVLPVYKNFSVQPEILFNAANGSKGNDFTTYFVNNTNPNANTNFNRSYLSIPILINYKISPKFTINAGPQFSLLIGSNENLMAGGQQAFKNNDFGIRGGVQFYPFTTFDIFASYYGGLTNVNNIRMSDGMADWKNKQFFIGVHVVVFTPKKDIVKKK